MDDAMQQLLEQVEHVEEVGERGIAREVRIHPVHPPCVERMDEAGEGEHPATVGRAGPFLDDPL